MAQTIGKGVELILEVQGMSCQHCVANVKRALESIDGVEEALPELSSGLVRIKGTALDEALLTKAVENAGYQVIQNL